MTFRSSGCNLLEGAALLLPLLVASPAGAQSPGELAAQARADSNDERLHYEVARAFWAEKNWDDAEHHLREAIAVAPQYAEALLALGELPYARGDKYWKKQVKERGQAATDSLLSGYTTFARRAFLINPLVDLSIWGKAEFGADGSYGMLFRLVWWLPHWRRGATLLHEGRVPESYAIFDSLRRSPRFGEVADAPSVILWYHGLAAGRLRQWEPAIEDFAILTGRGVHDDTLADQAGFSRYRTNDLRYILATMLYLGGRYAQARATFQRVLEIDLGMYPAHVQLARMYEAAGEADAGIHERERAVAVFPEDGTLHLELGVALLRSGRTEPAIEALREAVRVNPRDYRAVLLLGDMLMAAGRDTEARSPYERFLAIAPLRLKTQIGEVRQALARIPP